MTSPTVPKPIHVWFPRSSVDRMLSLMESSQLPLGPPIPGAGWQFGVDFDWLCARKQQFVEELYGAGWSQVERELNRFHHYTVEIEGIDLHFIHEPSSDPEGVPLLLLHGWPGTFYDFHKIIEPLSKPQTPDVQSFHVVVPSLPGFGLSSYPPRDGWTIADTARVMHKLMHDVLGYKRYAGQAGDWGSYALRALGATQSNEADLLHMNMFPCPPTGILGYVPYLPLPKVLISGMEALVESLTLSPIEQRLNRRSKAFVAEGRGYNAIQETRPYTIGFAIGSSPLALLTYIGEKMYSWSDPTSFDPRDLIITTAIYYLTDSFATSVMVYHQSRDVVTEMVNGASKWQVRSKMGYTAFPYEPVVPPRSWIAACGNLVLYREHATGGHFPALDNPKDLVDDVRELAARHW